LHGGNEIGEWEKLRPIPADAPKIRKPWRERGETAKGDLSMKDGNAIQQKKRWEGGPIKISPKKTYPISRLGGEKGKRVAGKN